MVNNGYFDHDLHVDSSGNLDSEGDENSDDDEFLGHDYDLDHNEHAKRKLIFSVIFLLALVLVILNIFPGGKNISGNVIDETNSKIIIEDVGIEVNIEQCTSIVSGTIINNGIVEEKGISIVCRKAIYPLKKEIVEDKLLSVETLRAKEEKRFSYEIRGYCETNVKFECFLK